MRDDHERPIPFATGRLLATAVALALSLSAATADAQSTEGDEASDSPASEDAEKDPAVEALEAADPDEKPKDGEGKNADEKHDTEGESSEKTDRGEEPETTTSRDDAPPFFGEETSEFLKRNERRADSVSVGFRASPQSVTGPTLSLHATEGLGMTVAGGNAGLLYDSPAPYALDATIIGVYPPGPRKAVVTVRGGAGLSAIGAGPVTMTGVHASAEATWHIEFTPVEIGVDYRPILLFDSDAGWSLLHLGVVMRYRFPSQR